VISPDTGHASGGYACAVTTLRELLDACDAAVRMHLDPDEQALAVGRCEDMNERGSLDQGGAAWTYVMVTNRRLRWVPHANLQFEASLDFDDVTSVSERYLGHRYAIALEHTPLTRPHWAPVHRFLVFQWGNEVVNTPLTRSEFAFSRRDTQAALALRGQVRGKHSGHR
jgi:hypothetical protein